MYLETETIFKEIFDNIMNDTLPQHKIQKRSICSEIKKVENVILEVKKTEVTLLSARGKGKPRIIDETCFRKVWKHDIEKDKSSHGYHGAIVRAMFNLHPKVGFNRSSRTIYLRDNTFFESK